MTVAFVSRSAAMPRYNIKSELDEAHPLVRTCPSRTSDPKDIIEQNFTSAFASDPKLDTAAWSHFSFQIWSLVQKLTQRSEYSFSTTSNSSNATLFAFSQGENPSDLLPGAAWCLPSDESQYLTDLHDHGAALSGDVEDSMFNSGQTTPKGTRINHTHQPMEATWNTGRVFSATAKSQAMSRMSSSTSGCSSVSNGSGLPHTNPMVTAAHTFQDDAVQVMGAMHMNPCQMSETVGSPILWPGYALEMGLDGDCSALTVEDMNPMNVAPSQVTFGLNGMTSTSPSSSWDGSSPISRTPSPNTLDESWRAAAMANSPLDNFMGGSTRYVTNYHQLQYATADSHNLDDSPESKPLTLVSDMADGMVPLGGAVDMVANYKHRSSIESDSPRDDARYKNAARQSDGLFHCPWEGEAGCNHKPEKLKCNYDKYVDSHLKPYKCKVATCEDARFSSTACRLRHEREAHGLHGHGNKPFLCTYEGCERSQAGLGFPRQWNLRDHMKRVHNDTGDVLAAGPSPAPEPVKGRKRKTETQEHVTSERKAPPKPAPLPNSRKFSTKPLLDEWQDHYQALQGILQGMVAPGDHRNLSQISEMQKHSAEMAKITTQLVSASKSSRDPAPKKAYTAGG